jgi:hypothetical protein
MKFHSLTPSHWKVVKYWVKEEESFPQYLTDVYGVEPDRPACFGCGRRPPYDGMGEHFNAKREWNATTSLKLAQLAKDGPTVPSNYVLLCWYCHRVMPTHDNREAAISWVNARLKMAFGVNPIVVRVADNPHNVREWAEYIIAGLKAMPDDQDSELEGYTLLEVMDWLCKEAAPLVGSKGRGVPGLAKPPSGWREELERVAHAREEPPPS